MGVYEPAGRKYDFDFRNEITYKDPIKRSLQILYKLDFTKEMIGKNWGGRSGENLVYGYDSFRLWVDRFLMQDDVIALTGATREEMETVLKVKNEIRYQMDLVICQLTYNDIGSAMIIPKSIANRLIALHRKIEKREGTPKEAWEELDSLNKKIGVIARVVGRSWR
jgi:hypothetical protein